MRKNKLAVLLAALMCLILCAFPAPAAQSGSLRVTVADEPGLEVLLYRVADENGILTEAFSGAEMAPETLLDTLEAKKNAQTLYSFARDKEISAETAVIGENGAAVFAGLELGCYLVACAGETPSFDPFLAFIPTVINGETVYDVEAEPKAEEPDPTTEPPETQEPTEPAPSIPQTGNSVIPEYVLLGLGCLLALIGMAELLRGRKEAHE